MMKRLYLLIVVLLISFQSDIFGQDIAEDDCVDAIELTDLDNFCDKFFEGEPTYDSGTSNCSSPADLPNVWFKFTAQGPELSIEARLGSGEDIVIALGEFQGVPCASSFQVKECTVNNPLEFDELEEGNVYYISIAFNPTDPDQIIQFCINNPPDKNPPPNDHPCDAIDVAPGDCEGGTTFDASPDFQGGCPQEFFQNTVWYRTTVSQGNNTLTAELSGLGQGVVGIIDFDGNCNNTSPTYLDIVCGQAPLEAVAHVEAGKTYYIIIGTSEENEANFTLCLEESGPPPGCAEHDDCNSADDFGTLIHDEPAECLDGCNIGGSPDVGIQGCFDPGWVSTYYEFRTDGQANRATITVESDDPNVGAIAVTLLTGPCNNPTYLDCQRGANGSVSLDGSLVQPNTTYYLMVSTPEGGTGEMEVCAQTFRIPDDYCVGRDIPADTSRARLSVTSTSMGSPKGGPYEPGEQVTFEYYVPNYAQTNSVQWLQGIVPIFGTGWDPASFDGQGQPLIFSGPNSHGASWNWYPDGNVTYNGTSIVYTVYQDTLGALGLCYYTDPMCPNDGIQAGDGLPAGWFAARPAAACTFNGHPSTGWGDGLSGPWTVTFTLKVRPLTGPESCTETGYIDCSVKMFTFGDEQTGCWDGANDPNACAGDEYRSSKAVTNCCLGPEVFPDDATICSGDQVEIELESDMDPDTDFSWTVSAPPTVIGASNGSSRYISDRLTNTGSTIATVTYTVTGSAFACPGMPTDILVDVLPEIKVEAGNDLDGCAQVEFTLGGSPTATGGDGGPYDYEWNNGADPVANPVVVVNTTTTFRVTVTDGNNCTAIDTVRIEVMDAVLFNIEGEDLFCEDDVSTLEIDPISGEIPYSNITWTGPGGFSGSGEEVEITRGGVYTVFVEDANGCEGEKEIEINTVTPPRIVQVTPPDSLCDGQVAELNIVVIEDFEWVDNYTITWFNPDGEELYEYEDVESIEIDEPGTYIVKVVDDFGCEQIDSFVILPGIPPQPVIIGDEIICEGSNTMLELDEEYATYTWSGGETDSKVVVHDPGEYSVTVTTGSGCEGVATFTVEIDGDTYADAGEEMVITCYEPSVTLDGSGSSTEGDFEYLWTTDDGEIESGEETLTPVVTEAGVYTLLVTNSESGCTSTSEVTVSTDLDQPVVEIESPEVLDCVIESVDLVAAVEGNEGDFSYEWTSLDGNIAAGQSSSSATVTEPGTYTLVVTNEENGCTTTETVEVEENITEPEIEAIDDLILTCTQPDGVISAQVSTQGEAEYNWTSTTDNIVGASDEADLEVNGAGTITLIVTDDANGCTSTITLEITEDQEDPTADAGEEMTLTCDVESVFLDGTGSSQGAEFEYEWETTDGNIIDVTNPLGPEVDAAGTYILTVRNTENGCESTSEVQVQLDENYPDVDAGDGKELTCAVEEIMLDATQGTSQGSEYDIQWSTQDGNIVTGENGLTPLVDAPGTYVLTVENLESGCISTDEVEVNLNTTEPEAQVADAEEWGCDTETMTLSGNGSSTGDYSYEWTGNPGKILEDGNTLNPIIGEPGTYILKVTDNHNGCSSTAEVIVSESSDVPTVSAGENKLITCENPQVQLDGSADAGSVGGTLSHQWNVSGGGNIVAGEDTYTPTVDRAGIYELHVINLDNGCVNTSTVEVKDSTALPLIAEGEVYTITCDEPEINMDATTGTASSPTIIYSWENEDGDELGNGRSLKVSEPGTYTFTVIDEFTGCENSVDFTVDENIVEPTVDIAQPEILTCDNEVITLDANASDSGGNFEGEWTASNGGVIDGDGDGYTLEVTVPGTYTFEVKNIENGCTTSASVEVTEDKDPPSIEPIDDVTITCADPEISITAVAETIGDAGYSWTSDNNIITGGTDSPEVKVNGEGTLTLVVTDQANNCTNSIEVKIIEDKEAPIADAGEKMTLTCDANTVTLNGSASSIGSQYTYEWTSPDGGNINSGETTLNPVVDVAATYILTVMNNDNGCSATSQVIVEIDENLPQIKFNSVEKLTCERTEVTIDASQSSQGSSLTYTWTTQNGEISSENGLDIKVTKPGTYTLTIVDNSNNCEATADVTVEEDLVAPEVEIEDPGILDCQTTSLSLTGMVIDAQDGYSVEWITQDGRILGATDTEEIEVNKVGTYRMVVTYNNNGCSAYAEVTVEASEDTPIADAGPDMTLTCVDTLLTIEAGNSSFGGDYDIEWRTIGGNIVDGADGLNPTVNQGGDYILTVTNTSNMCVSIDTMHVDVNQVYPVLDYDVSNEINCTYESATIKAKIDQAVEYSVEWYFEGQLLTGENDENLNVTQGGTYTLIVVNTVSECYSTSDIVVNENTNIITDVNIATIDPSCYGETTGCLIIEHIEGGESPYSIYIDDELKGSAMRICNLRIGDHKGKIVDKNGCEFEIAFTINEQVEYYVDLGEIYEVEKGDSLILKFDTDIPEENIQSIEWSWSSNEPIPCRDCRDLAILPTETVKVFVRVTDMNGCVFDAWVNVLVRKSPRIYVPTAFTPNDDGNNDILTVYADEEEVEEILLFEVYDRWGERVFYRDNFAPNDEANGWDGTFKGEMMQPAVFVFKVQALLKDGSIVPVNGTSTLLK